jgi:glycosyltransferase involved in cell wall biosynthesis
MLQEGQRKATFQYLENIGFVRKVEGESGTYYKLTQAGLRFLEKYPGIELKLLEERGLAPRTAGESDLQMFIEWPTVGWQVPNPHVTVLIPTRNEADTIGELIDGLPRHFSNPPQVLVVDKSDDATPWVAMMDGARVIRQYGRGKGNALRQILPAIESNIVLLMDGDGSMRPEEIPVFVQAMASGADIVKGSRFMRHGGSLDLSLLRRIGNLFFVLLVNLLWSTKYTDLCYGFMAFKKDALKKMAPHLRSDDFEIETEICIKAKKLGLSVREVPSVELSRKAGSSKLSAIHDGIRILKTIMKELVMREPRF